MSVCLCVSMCSPSLKVPSYPNEQKNLLQRLITFLDYFTFSHIHVYSGLN